MRLAYAVAAALVLVIGGGILFRGAPQANQMQPLMITESAADESNLIARDGGVQPAEDEAEAAYAAWKKIATDQPDAAVETLKALAAEYSGACILEGEDICRIELPCAYMEDFLNAASRIGTELDSEIGSAQADTAVVYIQLCKE